MFLNICLYCMCIYVLNLILASTEREELLYDDVDLYETDVEILSELEEDTFNIGKFDLLVNLSRGKSVADVTPLVAEDVLTRVNLCDIEKLPGVGISDAGEKKYLASVCIVPVDCETSKGFELYTNSSCGEQYMCCRVDKIRSFKQHGLPFKPVREISYDWNVANVPAIIGQFQHYGDRETRHRVWDKSKVNQTLMDMFPVCGVKRLNKNITNSALNLFFCVREDLCGKFPDGAEQNVSVRTRSAMNKFCENVPIEKLYPSKSKNRVCCENYRIKELILKDEKDIEYYPWNGVPHIPLNLKFAPGFRASYMCEAYARMMCDGGIDECEYSCPLDYKYTQNNQFQYEEWVNGDQVFGEIPHQALVGVYREQFLLLFHCGGTLISRRWVLTAQRCKYHRGQKVNLILLGMTDLLEPFERNKDEVVYLVAENIDYPFGSRKVRKSKTDFYDYTLLKTHKEVEFTKFIKPACLYHSDPPPNMQELFFTGFGGSYNFIKRIKFPKITGGEFPIDCRNHYLYPPEDPYYSTYGSYSEGEVICGRTWRLEPDKLKYETPCQYDEGGPLQFRLSIPYCMYQIYAVLSSKRGICNKSSYYSAFQTIKFTLHEIEDIVWRYPFLEDFPAPIINIKNFDKEPIWYDDCDPSKCPPYVGIIKHYPYKDPDVVHTTDYNISIVRDLDKGILSKVFDEAAYITYENDVLCDVERHNKTQSLDMIKVEQKYIPALCVNPNKNCSSTFGGKYSASICEQESKVCCSAANVPEITDALGTSLNLLAHDDILKYKFHDDFVVSSAAQENMSDKEYADLNDKNNREAIEKEYVCGIKTIAYKNNVTRYTPFFCTKETKCRRPPDLSLREKREGKKVWSNICSNGGEFVKDLEVKTKCCHPLNVLSSNFTQDRKFWEFRELPTYLKYAPGVRSAYKCEDYHRYICEGDVNWCVHYQEARFARPREIPHMAQIGFIVPKMLFFYCGGAIVSPRYILSSASCGFRRGIVANVVLVGDNNQSIIVDQHGWEKLYELREVLPYPFERKKPFNSNGVISNNIIEFLRDQNVFDPFIDIALFRTIEDIVFSPRIRPICLFYDPVINIRRAVFTGFGYVPENFTRSEIMKTDPIDIKKGEEARRWEDCANPRLYDKKRYPYYSEAGGNFPYLFCGVNAGYKEGPCKYDDGGPLQIELDVPYCAWQLLGVLVTGHNKCHEASPLLFINITKFLTEIEDVLWPLPFLNIISKTPPTCMGDASGNKYLDYYAG